TAVSSAPRRRFWVRGKNPVTLATPRSLWSRSLTSRPSNSQTRTTCILSAKSTSAVTDAPSALRTAPAGVVGERCPPRARSRLLQARWARPPSAWRRSCSASAARRAARGRWRTAWRRTRARARRCAWRGACGCSRPRTSPWGGDEFSTVTLVTKSAGAAPEDVCMSVATFVGGLVVMLAVLVLSSVVTAVLCLRVRTIPSAASTYPPDSSFHAFSTVSGKTL
ncbi:hypothetical protein C7M84_015717, partial [Penaeus vannamei]